MLQTELNALPNILSFIDPNLSHEEWFKVLAGIKSEFGEPGRQYALEWSQQGDSFELSAFNASWSSAKASKITFGTVVHFAKEGGYQPEKSDIKPISKEKMAEREAKRIAAQQKAEAEQAKKHQTAALTAKELFSKSVAVSSHPYLEKKQIPASYFSELDGNLIIPIYKESELVNIQQISPSGEKKFLYGGEISGCSTTIDNANNKDTILICEGVATGVSLHRATGWTVVVAYNAGNLPKVTKSLAEQYPNSKILVCGDNDQFKEKNAGLEASKKAVLGINTAHYVLPEFSDVSSKPTDFNDLMILQGIEAVKEQISTGLDELAEKIKQASFPEGFSNRAGKIFYRNPYEENAEPVHVCSELEVIGISRDKNQRNWGRVLKFKDMDKHEHILPIPMEVLAGDAIELRSALLEHGLQINSHPKSRNLLRTFIQDSTPTKRFVNVPQIGWHGGVYVLPGKTIGSTKEEYILQSNTLVDMDFSQKGSLQDWQHSISQPCMSNSRLILALSTAFAASLISEFPVESGGVHFVGESSLGKTNALLVASSVWGSHKRLKTWRATGNALEGVSAMSNDSLLCLDELAEMSPRDAGTTVYMLANGQGKQRANKFGASKEILKWKLLFLSTGEINLETHLIEAGQKLKAGQAVRMIEIPADTGKFGLYEHIHHFESDVDFAKYIKSQTEEAYGTAGVAFIEAYVAQKKEARAFVEQQRESFLSILDSYQSGQVNRVLSRFAYIAAVGELATKLGITLWSEGEAIRSTKVCFEAWLENRGGDVNVEVEQALSEVRQFIERHGESRFTNINDTITHSRTINRAGYKKLEGNDVVYYFGVEVFRNEVCAGLDYKAVAKVLKDKGHLKHESGRLTCKTPTLEDQRRVQSYAVKSSILES